MNLANRGNALLFQKAGGNWLSTPQHLGLKTVPLHSIPLSFKMSQQALQLSIETYTHVLCRALSTCRALHDVLQLLQLAADTLLDQGSVIDDQHVASSPEGGDTPQLQWQHVLGMATKLGQVHHLRQYFYGLPFQEFGETLLSGKWGVQRLRSPLVQNTWSVLREHMLQLYCSCPHYLAYHCCLAMLTCLTNRISGCSRGPRLAAQAVSGAGRGALPALLPGSPRSGRPGCASHVSNGACAVYFQKLLQSLC